MKEMQAAYTTENKGGTQQEATFPGLVETARQIGNGWMALWQHHAVHLGVVVNGEIKWANEQDVVNENLTDHFVQLRAFNEEKEYHFWKTTGGIKGRFIEDTQENGQSLYIDTNMVLRGMIVKQYFSLTASIEPKEEEKKLTIKTRNYIDFNETGQAGYIDSRFVKFEIQKPEK